MPSACLSLPSNSFAPSAARASLWADAVRARWAVSVGSAVLAWLLYAACVAPTVTYGGDCGELIAASYRLGIAHPSGYPLYCLIGRLWADILPFGEVGWRYNLLSATLGALSVGLVAATAHRALWEGENPKRAAWASGSAALLLAGLYYFGSQNVLAEVYSLNAFFLALLLWHAVSWLDSGDWRHFYALALSFGLSLTAHLSGLFLGPALLGIAIIAPRQRFAPLFPLGARRLSAALALCAAGFALTLYLPLRSQLWPAPQAGDISRFWPLDWGHPASFGLWKDHVTAKAYGSLLFTPHKLSILGHEFLAPGFQQPLSLWPGKVWKLIEMMSLQLLAAAPFVVLGLVAPLLRARGNRAKVSTSTCSSNSARDGVWMRAWIAGSLAAAWALNVGVQINYDVNDIANFFFPAYIAQALWLAMGLDAAGRWLSTRTQNWAPRMRWRVHTLARLSLIGVVAVQWCFFLAVSSQRGETRARDRALESAASLEELERTSGARPVAFIFSNDALWAFWYAQYVLGRASRIETPWGALASESMRRAPQDELIARVKKLKRAPVVVAQWDDRLDKRFPLQLLPGSTSLCLASDRELPAPAALLPTSSNALATPNNIIYSARMRRTPLTRQPWESTWREFSEPLSKMGDSALREACQWGVPAFKRSYMAALDLEFARPNWPTIQESKREGAAHIGWLQVLVASLDTFKGAPPNRAIKQPVPAGELPFVHTTDPQLAAWTQSRRLIVPLGSKPGARLKAEFALEIHTDARDGLSQVWARLARDPKDTRTPWQRVDLIHISHR